MAVFDADLPVDTRTLPELDMFKSDAAGIEKAKPDEITITDGDLTVHMFGEFVVGSGGIFKGTITSLEVERDNKPIWDMAELSMDSVRFVERLEAGKRKQVVKDLFAKADLIDGSHFDDNLYGGKGADDIKGWKGDDIIAGEEGRDELTGYSGQDAFVFGENLNFRHADFITDFKSARDQIWLKESVFTALQRGSLDKEAFVKAHGPQDPDDRIIFRQGQGEVFYDPDGTGKRDKTKFMSIDPNKQLDHNDFLII